MDQLEEILNDKAKCEGLSLRKRQLILAQDIILDLREKVNQGLYPESFGPEIDSDLENCKRQLRGFELVDSSIEGKVNLPIPFTDKYIITLCEDEYSHEGFLEISFEDQMVEVELLPDKLALVKMLSERMHRQYDFFENKQKAGWVSFAEIEARYSWFNNMSKNSQNEVFGKINRKIGKLLNLSPSEYLIENGQKYRRSKNYRFRLPKDCLKLRSL